MTNYMQINNKKIFISDDVIAQVAGILANECPGVVGMAMISLKDGIYKLLKKESLKKGVEVIIDNNKLTLNLHIIVLYEINIPNVCNSIVESIQYTFKNILGIEVDKINIYVEGIKF